MSPILFFIIFFTCIGVGKIFLQINSAAVAFIDILIAEWEGLLNFNNMFINHFNEHYNFYGSVYYWQSLMCVSRYIIPKTGYMTATRSKKYDMLSNSKQTTYLNNIWSVYILRLTMSSGQFTKFSANAYY